MFELPFEVVVFAAVQEHVPKQQLWVQKQIDKLCCRQKTASRQQHCHLFSAAGQLGLALLLGLRLSGFLLYSQQLRSKLLANLQKMASEERLWSCQGLAKECSGYLRGRLSHELVFLNDRRQSHTKLVAKRADMVVILKHTSIGS